MGRLEGPDGMRNLFGYEQMGDNLLVRKEWVRLVL